MIQPLKILSFLLRVTCGTFARTTKTDVWQAIVARATESQKNCSKSKQKHITYMLLVKTKIKLKSLKLSRSTKTLDCPELSEISFCAAEKSLN